MARLPEHELWRMRKAELVQLVAWLQADTASEVRQLVARMATTDFDRARGAVAVGLAVQFETAEAKDLPSLARELRAVLAELQAADTQEPDGADFWQIVSTPLGDQPKP